MGLTQVTFHLFIKIKDGDHISRAVACKKPGLSNKCHSHAFHSIVFAEKKRKSQKQLYIKSRQKVLSQEQVSVIYGPGEKLGEVSSKNFTVLKLNRALLEGWSNCVFRTPCNFVTAISHAWVMAAGCPDAEVLDNLNSCLRGDTAGSPWVPNEHPGHCYLLWGVLSGYDKSQTKYLFRHSRLQLCVLRQSLTFSHARFWVLKFSIECYPLFLKTTYIIF